MKPQPPVIVQDFSKGIHTNYDDGLLPPNILRYTINMENDSPNNKIGRLISRKHITKYAPTLEGNFSGGSSISTTAQVVGMGTWNDSVSRNVFLVAINSPITRVFYWDSDENFPPVGLAPLGSTDFITGTVRFETFANYLIAVSASVAVDASSVAGFGTNYVNGVTALGKNLNIVKAFQGKLYLASDTDNSGASNTIYFSPQVLTAAWSTDYSFTLTGGNDNRVTGLEVNGNLLLIFKPDGIYTWDGYQTQSAPQYGVGAINQEVIKTIGTKTIFAGLNRDYVSVYMYEGSKPVDISEPVREFLTIKNLYNERIPREFGAWKDGVNYCLSVYDVTVDGILYRNVILVYNTEKNTWTIATIGTSTDTSVIGNFFKFSANHLYTAYGSAGNPYPPDILTTTGGVYKNKRTIIGGTKSFVQSTNSLGSLEVFQWNSSDHSTRPGDFVDNGHLSNTINILIQTHELDFGSKSRMKQLNKFDIFADGAHSIATVEYRIDGGKWESLGGLTGKRTTFEPGIQFKKLELRITGNLGVEPFILESIEFFDWSIEDYET